MYFEAFYLHVVSIFSCIPVICPKLVLFLTPLQFVHLFCNLSQVYPAVLIRRKYLKLWGDQIKQLLETKKNHIKMAEFKETRRQIGKQNKHSNG